MTNGVNDKFSKSKFAPGGTMNLGPHCGRKSSVNTGKLLSACGQKRLAATKLYWDKMLVNVAQGGADDRLLGPAVYLPEQRHLIGFQIGNKTE